MRIALVPSKFAPAIGGIEELTRQLAHQLVRDGDEVEIWTHRHDASLPLEDIVEGLVVRRFEFPMPSANAKSLARWPASAGKAVRAIRTARSRFDPDVIHVQGYSGNGAYAAVASRRSNSAFVITLQGETSMDDHKIYEKSVFLRSALRLGLRVADAVTACSNHTLDDAKRFGTIDDRASVVPNGVNLDEVVEATPVEVPFERYAVGFGRVVPNKGFDLLIRAFALIAPANPDVGLVIGGEGSQRQELEALARDLDIDDQVHFTGWLSRGQVAAVLDGAEVFVLPSRLEPFGVVVLEAMRASKPVIASSRGGVPSWLRGGTHGLVVDPNDTEELSIALARVLNDPSLATELAVNGRRHAEQFAWPHVAARYREIYRRVV